MSDVETQRISSDDDDDETIFLNAEETQPIDIGTDIADMNLDVSEPEPVERRRSARVRERESLLAQPLVTEHRSRSAEPKAPRVKKVPNAKPNHPAWASMMTDAVKSLNKKGGSSIQAVKKYILANFIVDSDKITPHLRRGLKVALTSGKLIQLKGKGLSGSFKLGEGAKVKAAKLAKSPAKTVATRIVKIMKSSSPAKKGTKKPKSPVKAKKTAPMKVVKAVLVTAPATTATTAAKLAATPATPKAKKAMAPAKPKSAKKAAANKIIKGKSAKSPKSRKAPQSKTVKKVVKAAAAK